MASTSVPNAEDNFICSICLDVFTNPVMIPVGTTSVLTVSYFIWKTGMLRYIVLSVKRNMRKDQCCRLTPLMLSW